MELSKGYQIESLRLTFFKSYKEATVDFKPGLNIITGKNGVGKTSLLDALRLMVFGKTYFSGSDKSCIRVGSSFCRASCKLMDDEDDLHTLVVKLQEGKAKVLEHDGKKVGRLSEFIGTYLSVCISPDDIKLVNGLSSDRREFVDQAIMQFDKIYTQHLIQYTKSLKQRNALLKQFLKKGYFDQNLLDSYDRILIESAPYIHEKRKDFLEEFVPIFKRNYDEIAPDSEEVAIEYHSKISNEKIENLLKLYLEKDRFSGRSNVGIHKDELSFVLNDMNLKSFGSQGQIKSFVFALKIALFEYFLEKTKMLPVLFLDDMFDKLDQSRVENILDRLNENWGAQVFITDTDQDRIPKFLLEQNKKNHHIHIFEDQTIEYSDV